MTSLTLGTGVLDVEPVAIDRVLVPVDGSPLSVSALRPAAALAQRFAAELHLVAFGATAVEARALHGLLESLAAEWGGTSEGRVHRTVATGVIDALGDEERSLLCMASHGRSGLQAATLGSVGGEVLANMGEPLVLVGPHLDPDWTLDGGDILACVDGSPASERILAPAASWSVALGLTLGVTTVAEPVPEPPVGSPHRRLYGPECDAWDYTSGIAAAWRLIGVKADPVVIYDAEGPAAGLWSYLQPHPRGLVAVRAHARIGWARMLLGSEATAIVRTSRVPVLVVPPHF